MDKLQFLKERELPFAKLLGITYLVASETGVKAEMMVRPDLCTRPDVLHGGAIMAFADTLGAVSTVLNLPEGKGTTTIESKTNFLGPAPVGIKVIGETTRPSHARLDDAYHDGSGQARGRRHPDTDGALGVSAEGLERRSAAPDRRPPGSACWTGPNRLGS
jgi:uncharacterized protein (TIGR00369 family)